MTRRTRRWAPKQAVQLTPPSPPIADPVPGPSTPPAEPVMEPNPPRDPDVVAKDRAAPEPLGGRDGDDDDGSASKVAASRKYPLAREKTLHELNLEARAIDREHARRREEAQAKVKEVIEPMLRGVMGARQVARRVQKNLRPPVIE
jgi:hypothetical protein